MEFIKIETITHNNKHLAFEISSEGLYNINCLSGLSIESLDKIYEICIIYDCLVLITEDRILRNGFNPIPFTSENRCENNVVAFNSDGVFLWNIGSIVGDIKMPFSSISSVLKSEAEIECGVRWPEANNILLKCIAGGFTFIIDVKNEKMLYKIGGKVK